MQQEKFREEFGFIYRSDVLKIIAGKIHRSPETYSEVPAFKPFLESFLEKDTTFRDFTDVRRAVRCVVDVQDTDFLPRIEEVLHKLANKRRNPNNFGDRTDGAEVVAFLREAMRFLEEMKLEN